jgi:methionyl-tRNA formyltransferase
VSHFISDTVKKAVRILIFGDIFGIPQLLRHIPSEHIIGFVVASNRPQYHVAVDDIAKRMKLPLMIQPSPTSEYYANFKKMVAELSPDLIWANSYSMIIRDDLMCIAKICGINIHGALLPQYRGCNPTEWAIINGENETGVTLHEMSSSIDEGGIIDQKRTPLYFEDTWRSATDRVVVATDQLISDNLESILTRRWRTVPQDDAKARYHRRRSPDDGRFQWSQPVIEIYNIVRALVAPHPGASYIGKDGNIVTIDEYETPAALTSRKYDQVGETFLRGQNIDLRPLGMGDIKTYLDWSKDQDKSVVGERLELMSLFEHSAWFEELLCKRTDIVVFVIQMIETKEEIGVCQVSGIEWEERCADLKLWISLKHKKFGGEAIDLLSRYGIDELNLLGFFRTEISNIG